MDNYLGGKGGCCHQTFASLHVQEDTLDDALHFAGLDEVIGGVDKLPGVLQKRLLGGCLRIKDATIDLALDFGNWSCA